MKDWGIETRKKGKKTGERRGNGHGVLAIYPPPKKIRQGGGPLS